MERICQKRKRCKKTYSKRMHVYQEDLADGVTSWECELRRRDQCQARVKLDRNDEFLKEVNDHTHPPT